MLSRLRSLPVLLVFFALFAALLARSGAQTAEWVWHPNDGAKPAAGEVRYFRHQFEIVGKVLKAELNAAADDEVKVWVNGKEVGESKSWKEPLKLDVTSQLRGGQNIIAAQATNVTDRAGFVFMLDLSLEYGKRQVIMTDRAWLASPTVNPGWEQPGYDTNAWQNVKLVAKLGAQPWGNVFNVETSRATPPEELTVPAGFKVELLRSAEPAEGSWVSLAVDAKGRLYISPQAKTRGASGGLMRVTLDDKGQFGKIERIELPVGAAMGMLWAFDSLYVSGDGPDGQAIYRLRDTNGDDALDAVQLMKKVPGGSGEHGAHALVVGPDQHLYITHGNSTPLVDGVAEDSPYQHYAEDTVLSRVLDPVATFFDKLKVPYGHVLRTDPEGKKWELYAAGFRNAYDIDFSPDGELFTYDSDMEWDVGLPWYRPTRIVHVPSAAEFGFREGSSKWPEYYPDSLPASVDVGLGSPTGVKFGTKSNFPEQYRKAFFAMDWTFGRILAVHLKPNGSSYTATFEDFLKGKGMPVADLEFGPDGAMYFVVGGRGTQAGLYRVSYVGSSDRVVPRSVGSVTAADDPAVVQARATRKQLETFHGKANPQAVETAWPHLNSDDRFVRFAARTAIEFQPVSEWRERALNEAQARPGLEALLALVRVGSKEDRDEALKALAKWPLASLDEPLRLNKLRVIELAFARHGRPSDELATLAIEKLSKSYPAESFAMNRELSEILAWLKAPGVVEKTLTLLEKAEKQEEQIWFAHVLREAEGWTPEQQARYFAWFNKARNFRGGNSMAKFITRIREIALAKVTDAQKAALADVLQPPAEPMAAIAPPGPARDFVKAWTIADLAPVLDKVNSGRDYERGREIFRSVQCLQCHLFAQEKGGNVGPDLTAVANRFNRRDLLEAILEPSKAISEQYASYVVTTKGGETHMGLITEQNNDHVKMITDLIARTEVTISAGQLQSREMSPVSLMPPGLLNVLKQEEILDLLAYIESGGNAKSAHFLAPK